MVRCGMLCGGVGLDGKSKRRVKEVRSKRRGEVRRVHGSRKIRDEEEER